MRLLSDCLLQQLFVALVSVKLYTDLDIKLSKNSFFKQLMHYSMFSTEKYILSSKGIDKGTFRNVDKRQIISVRMR